MFSVGYLSTPIGVIKVKGIEDKIVSIDFSESLDEKESSSEIVQRCLIELEEYFLGKRKAFTFKYELIGTDFQKNVWKIVAETLYGNTISYREVAKKVNNEKGVRAVANAIGRNPLLLLIPCHRVLRSNGGLGGFSAGLERKTYLLEHENYKV